MRTAATIALTVAALCACSDSSRHAAIPRPTAYPRVVQLGDSYHSPDSLAVRFMVNEKAYLHAKSAEWFDIEYPCYGATVYITVTAADDGDIDDIIANRRQRAAINIADINQVRTTTIESDEFTSELYESPATRSTPLQFVAGDGRRYVVSGAAFFANVADDAPIDSLSPMVAQIKKDLTKALSELTVWSVHK